MLRTGGLLPVLCAIACMMGCGTARMVNYSADGGIVAIPTNSNMWPYYHREEAKRLMAARCPGGFEIVKEEEVVIGQRSTTSEATERAKKDAERERSTSNVVTLVQNETEYRIHFRPLPVTPVVSSSVAAVPAPTSGIQTVGAKVDAAPGPSPVVHTTLPQPSQTAPRR